MCFLAKKSCQLTDSLWIKVLAQKHTNSIINLSCLEITHVGYRILVISNTSSKIFLKRFSMDEIMAYRNFWYLPQPLLSRLSSAYIFKTAKFILSYRFFLCNHLFISLSITQSDQGWTLIVLIKSGEMQVRVGCQNGILANLQKAMEIRSWSQQH